MGYIVEFDETVKLDVPLDHQRGSTTCRVPLQGPSAQPDQILRQAFEATRAHRQRVGTDKPRGEAMALGGPPLARSVLATSTTRL